MGEYTDVLIHVGYHKTGSTLLQKRLFVPELGNSSPWRQDFYHRHLLLDRPDRRWSARVRAAFDPGIDRARQSSLRPVLSCEALSGDPWRLGQANGYGNFHAADTLAEAFPGARIVLVHREQVSMLVSLYKHSTRSHWRYSLGSFLDQSPRERGMAPIFNFGYLEYSHLLQHYHDLFDSQAVFSTPYEEIKTPQSWASRWSTIMGQQVAASLVSDRENPGMAAATVRAKRVANFAIAATATPNSTRSGRVINSAAGVVDARVPTGIRRRSELRLRDEVASFVGNRFAEDNARLRVLTNEDWQAHGYA